MVESVNKFDEIVENEQNKCLNDSPVQRHYKVSGFNYIKMNPPDSLI
ncbi:15507_t:CDS:2 [Gigaspora margarita]|uniref:15507_t:CDS:1 n=1 Tax=Gigaspora margarita TaxID=4874 RepID=A0ABN7UT52_GIGMA|nr:15507_t:CDS:2 [Gigaspora margarita]